MSVSDPCLIRSRGPSGEPVVRLGVPLVDDYLEFLAGRCRTNTMLAAAYDLRVFFSVVGKPAEEVRPADVLGFITAQRTGRRHPAIVAPAAADEELTWRGDQHRSAPVVDHLGVLRLPPGPR
jgi:integrase/recombinase XerD